VKLERLFFLFQIQYNVAQTYTTVYPNVSGLTRQRNNNNKHSLRSNTKDCGGKTH